MRTEIPEHADLTDPEQRSYWERWAAVGDAKAEAQQLAHGIEAARARWQRCKQRAGKRGQTCDCGGCEARYLEARDVYAAAATKVMSAIRAFKDGT